MKNEIELLMKLRNQLAHTFAAHGDKPDELMHKLECLVLEWFMKGLQSDKS